MRVTSVMRAACAPGCVHRLWCLKGDGSVADPLAMWERCRYCGSSDDRELVLIGGELACTRCAGSPICDRCGHPRGIHTGVCDKHSRTCKHVWVDFQTGTKVTCHCAGFASVTGRFRDAEFANAAEEDTPLRIVQAVNHASTHRASRWTVVPRRDRTSARGSRLHRAAPLFAGSGADALRTAIAKACGAAAVPPFSAHDLRHRGSASSTGKAAPGPTSARSSVNATWPSPPTHTRTSSATDVRLMSKDHSRVRAAPVFRSDPERGG
jgi:hypothetical protein